MKLVDNHRFPLADGSLRQPGDNGQSKRGRKRKTPVGVTPNSAGTSNLDEEEKSEAVEPEPQDSPESLSEVGGSESLSTEKDFWSLSGDFMVRYHVTP